MADHSMPMASGKRRTGSGKLALAVSVSVVAVVWLVVLPWLAKRPQQKAHLDWLEQRGIDPSAMYYTELEAMEPILQRQRAAQFQRAAQRRQAAQRQNAVHLGSQGAAGEGN